MIKHLILGGLCHIHSTVSGPLHYLHSPLAVSSRNSADPELSSPWHSARQRIWDASSTEPWAEVQHVSTDSKIFQTQKRRHTTSYDVMWISLPHLDLVGRVVGWSSIFWVPGGLRRTVLKQNRSDLDHQTSMFEQNLQIVATGMRNTSKPTGFPFAISNLCRVSKRHVDSHVIKCRAFTTSDTQTKTWNVHICSWNGSSMKFYNLRNGDKAALVNTSEPHG